MKKILLLAVALLGMAAGAEAQTLAVDGNEFVALKGKQATLAIKVTKGTDDIRDVMFDITLPEGVSLNGNPTAPTGYTAVASDVKEGNKYTVIVYSAPESGNPSTITSTGVINIPLTVPETFDDAKLWKPTITLSSTANGKVTNDAAVETSAESTAYTFEVGLLGDANKNGEVKPNDAQAVLQYSIGTIPPVFSKVAADAYQASGEAEGTIKASDAQAVLRIALGL